MTEFPDQYTARQPFTLHIRLTHACNASCSYCSSWQRDPDERMTLAELEKCLDGLEAFWEATGISPSYLNVEYVGGEIMLIPTDDLEVMVNRVRERLSPRMVVRDGAQSNLIGSPRRIAQLYALFENRVGTSVDHFTDQRQLGCGGGSQQQAHKYRVFFMSSNEHARSLSGQNAPGVITIDRHNINHVTGEIQRAIADKRNITLRPVFQGGSRIESITNQALGEALVNGFNHWMKARMPVRVEPFVSLLRGLLDDGASGAFCAWQRDCAIKSLSIEPNGDFYVCQELADMGQYRLGNFLKGEFDLRLHRQLARRVEMLERGCFDCPYFKACQGGCMQQSVEAGSGMYGKTQWCEAWKLLFSAMQAHIDAVGKERLLTRLNGLHPGF